MSYIQAGKDEGARLVTGGERVGHKGYYIQPTIFADVQVSLVHKKNLDSFSKGVVAAPREYNAVSFCSLCLPIGAGEAFVLIRVGSM